MIHTKELKTVADFESLQKGDFVACEFHRDVHDHPKKYRFKVFPIVKVRTDTKEVILQTKNNIYFNYQMFVDADSILKSAVLIISLPEGYVSPKNELPENGEEVMVITDKGRETLARFESFLGNQIWETNYEHGEDEMIVGWKKL